MATTNARTAAPIKLIMATLLTSRADPLDHSTCFHKQIERQPETRAVRQKSIYNKVSGCGAVFEPAVRRLHAALGGIRRQELNTSELGREFDRMKGEAEAHRLVYFERPDLLDAAQGKLLDSPTSVRPFASNPILLSLYDVSVPVFRQYLAALSGILAKAETHCTSGSLAEADVIGFRLFEDMQPFWFQVRQSIVHSAGAVATLRGQSYPRAEGLETLQECRAVVDAAAAYLDAVKPSDLSLDPGADVALMTPRGATINARDFLLALSYGHFFFHVTTAYDILRHQGVPIGKRDFMGEVLVRRGDESIDAWEEDT